METLFYSISIIDCFIKPTPLKGYHDGWDDAEQDDMKGTKEDDGDYQFNLALEPPYRKLLNQENYKQ